jgi:hypothetical protein
MANHKRKRPKNRRAGCLMCKPHKANGAKEKDHHTVRKKKAGMHEQEVCAGEELIKRYSRALKVLTGD